jgi:hypothetical protein
MPFFVPTWPFFVPTYSDSMLHAKERLLRLDEESPAGTLVSAQHRHARTARESLDNALGWSILLN